MVTSFQNTWLGSGRKHIIVGFKSTHYYDFSSFKTPCKTGSLPINFKIGMNTRGFQPGFKVRGIKYKNTTPRQAIYVPVQIFIFD